MDIRSVDLNLLVVFEAMSTHGSVTRAAEALDLSQPAMSAAVSRLRAVFDDPLFVRTGSHMRPTPRAAELAPAVQRVIDTVRGEILQGARFEPLLTQKRFTILTPDIGEVTLMPRILTRLTSEAPHACIRSLPMPSQTVAEALETGEADMAFGHWPDLDKAGYFQHRLGRTHYVCITRRDHPAFQGGITLDQFLQASHVVVKPDGRESMLERALHQKTLRRHVAAELTHFMSLLAVVGESDLIACVPRDLGEFFERHGPIKVWPLPFKSPVLEMQLTWHRQVHKDPANVWLRALIRQLFDPEPLSS